MLYMKQYALNSNRTTRTTDLSGLYGKEKGKDQGLRVEWLDRKWGAWVSGLVIESQTELLKWGTGMGGIDRVTNTLI